METLKDFREYRKLNGPQKIEFYSLLDLLISVLNANAGMGIATAVKSEIVIWFDALGIPKTEVEKYIQDRVNK